MYLTLCTLYFFYMCFYILIIFFLIIMYILYFLKTVFTIIIDYTLFTRKFTIYETNKFRNIFCLFETINTIYRFTIMTCVSYITSFMFYIFILPTFVTHCLITKMTLSCVLMAKIIFAFSTHLFLNITTVITHII